MIDAPLTDRDAITVKGQMVAGVAKARRGEA
jgi:hypothetical protein